MGSVAKSVGNFVSNAWDSVSSVADKVIDGVESAAHFAVNAALTTTGIKYLDKQLTGGLISNTINGVIDNVAGIVHGAVEGDWTKFRDSAIGTVTTAVAVAAIAAGAVTGNWWAVAAGVTVLDAQYNQGETLHRMISIAGNIEHAVFNTNYIESYANEIQALITVGASIYAGYSGTPSLIDISGIGELTARWAVQLQMMQTYIGSGYGLYQIYSAVASIRASQEYWIDQLRQAEEYYRNLMEQTQQAREQWFSMMTDPDVINRILPGGDMFFMGSGHDLFSITDVAEPKYALGMIDRSDPEMDRLINNCYGMFMPGTDDFIKYNNGG